MNKKIVLFNLFWFLALMGWKPKGVIVILENDSETSNNPLVALYGWYIERKTIANIYAFSRLAQMYPDIMRLLQNFPDLDVSIKEFDENGISLASGELDDDDDPPLLDCPCCNIPLGYSSRNGYSCEICGKNEVRD